MYSNPQAGSEAVIIYNTKPGGSLASSGADWEQRAGGVVERLQRVLNPRGVLASRQMRLSSEAASTPLAEFLQVGLGGGGRGTTLNPEQQGAKIWDPGLGGVSHPEALNHPDPVS